MGREIRFFLTSRYIRNHWYLGLMNMGILVTSHKPTNA